MKSTGKMKPFAKIAIIVVVLGALILGYNFMGGSEFLSGLAPNPNDKEDRTDLPTGSTSKDVITVGVVTWGGYAGGEYFNEGFKASKKSRFYKDYGILVEFKLIDDFMDSRNAWKSGDIDLCWATIDAFTTEIEGLSQFNPRVIFQADWSRGGDAIVVRQGINNVADLKGKKIAVAPMTPSHTFLLSLFEAGEVSMSDVKIIEVPNAIDAADLFKKKRVDAAVVWSPDDEDCITKVSGSKVLMSTKTARHIIADVFFVKEEFLNSHEDQLSSLIEGWLRGSAEINSSDKAKRKAAKILSNGLDQPEDFCYLAINNARLCTYGDNINFFNLTGKFNGVTGEDLYNNMSLSYASVGYISKDKSGNPNVESWRTISDPSIIRNITSLTGSKHEAEGSVTFTPPTLEEETAEAISTKRVTITFPIGSYRLDGNSKYIIDKEFVQIAKGFSNARIRIEGNTDNTGSYDLNRRLSLQRANAVSNYLSTAHGFDKNRFVVLGNGPDNPIAPNTTKSGRSKNRRTDFELLPN